MALVRHESFYCVADRREIHGEQQAVSSVDCLWWAGDDNSMPDSSICRLFARDDCTFANLHMDRKTTPSNSHAAAVRLM